jgi:hypothetical protein
MPKQTTISSRERAASNTSSLREKALADKAARRRYLVTAPIPEKLRILEEMRDLTSALKKNREENKAAVRAARASVSK